VHLPKSRYEYFVQNRTRIMDSARVESSKLAELDSLESEEINEPAPTTKRYTYRVRRGDNLTSVARKLGLTVVELRRLNRIKGNKLRKGQVLIYYKLVKAKSGYIRKSSNRKYKKSRTTSRKKKKSKSKKRRKRR
jgi:membrane-bound lytic murein transglycosylase D